MGKAKWHASGQTKNNKTFFFFHGLIMDMRSEAGISICGCPDGRDAVFYHGTALMEQSCMAIDSEISPSQNVFGRHIYLFFEELDFELLIRIAAIST